MNQSLFTIKRNAAAHMTVWLYVLCLKCIMSHHSQSDSHIPVSVLLMWSQIIVDSEWHLWLKFRKVKYGYGALASAGFLVILLQFQDQEDLSQYSLQKTHLSFVGYCFYLQTINLFVQWHRLPSGCESKKLHKIYCRIYFFKCGAALFTLLPTQVPSLTISGIKTNLRGYFLCSCQFLNILVQLQLPTWSDARNKNNGGLRIPSSKKLWKRYGKNDKINTDSRNHFVLLMMGYMTFCRLEPYTFQSMLTGRWYVFKNKLHWLSPGSLSQISWFIMVLNQEIYSK